MYYEDSEHSDFDLKSSYRLKVLFLILAALEVADLGQAYARRRLNAQQLDSWWGFLFGLTLARLTIYVHCISSVEIYVRKVLTVHTAGYISFIMLCGEIHSGLLAIVGYANTCLVRTSLNLVGFVYILCTLSIVSIVIIYYVIRMRLICLNLFDNILTILTLGDEV